ncbi:molybdopterin-synthase adenylyltransferase MoeB [Carboxylicivirga sp. RSCT41]|uniref:molybdopterin-synthase adenylyltransferase MoeB n=1 Tax=Carboxylicivirga agarovorans TaxID=3417570 RepID=UPI003D329641
MSLTREELERYKRHTILPEIGVEGQQKIKNASVLIVGTGGLGSPIAMYLAASGVGHIGLIDFDVVDESNLQRQIIHKSGNVGISKTISAEATLKELNPYLKVSLFNMALTADNALDIIKQFDIVTDGTDNFATRYLVNDACVISGKVNVFGSIRQFEGQLSVFGTKEGPCYRCLFPEPPEPGTVPSCADAGVMGVLPGVIGTLQATEVIKQITGIGEPLTGRLLNYDALGMRFSEVKFMKDPDCPCCGDNPAITELIDYDAFCGTQQVLTADITASELKEMHMKNEAPFLVDVREPAELLQGEIKGALNIPMREVQVRMHEIPKEQTVVVYCHLGIRSAHVIEYLVKQGYTKLFNLTGGYDAWESLG